MEPLRSLPPLPPCIVCNRASVPNSPYCESCRRLLNRGPKPFNRQARLRALCEQWDPEIGGFRCYFTDAKMIEDDGRRRRSATWEHLAPGNESSVVLVARVINTMKTDMTEDEFERIVRALAKAFEGRQFDESAFPADPHGSR
jgi:hypothetical protein